MIPKKKVDLTKFFDKVDLGMNIGDWDEFEKEFKGRKESQRRS
ncbi:MAG: hypothetical protein BME93_01215 [Methanosarcinales archaeon Met12]|nr:MAG: hypothetical protein BME93_01215 [Methanosarcinales archaeon Met12]